MTFIDYIKPELLILIPVLYILGCIIKDSATVQNRFIPAILGAVGVFLALLYVAGSTGISVTGIFTAITQGILIAGAAVYTNEIIAQFRRSDEKEQKPEAEDEEDESHGQ
jgi:1,4-dihydroxy-2-naphthoate octaprenyltransferase